MLIIKNSSKSKSLKKAPEGTYESSVKKVRWAEGAENEEAFEIVYDLENAEGEKFWHREIFKNTAKNPRTKKFFEYLLDNGIEDLDELAGKKEKLVLEECEGYDGNTYVNITARAFI